MELSTNKIVIRQGDQMSYALPAYIGNTILREKDIEEIEVCIGTFIQKYYSKGDIVFNDDLNYFEIRLSQEDTFSLLPSRGRFGYFEYPSQVRIELKVNSGYPGYIYSFPGPNVEVLESLSKERL